MESGDGQDARRIGNFIDSRSAWQLLSCRRKAQSTISCAIAQLREQSNVRFVESDDRKDTLTEADRILLGMLKFGWQVSANLNTAGEIAPRALQAGHAREVQLNLVHRDSHSGDSAADVLTDLQIGDTLPNRVADPFFR